MQEYVDFCKVIPIFKHVSPLDVSKSRKNCKKSTCITTPDARMMSISVKSVHIFKPYAPNICQNAESFCKNPCTSRDLMQECEMAGFLFGWDPQNGSWPGS